MVNTKMKLGIAFLSFIIAIAIYLFLGAWILQLAYNNSIPEMTKDVKNNNKQTVAKLGYWNAFALIVLLSFVPLSVHSFNISTNDK